MNLETGLLFEATQSADLVERLRMYAVTEKDFDDPGSRRAYRFIASHYEEHATVPEVKAVTDICRVGLEPQGVDSRYLLEEFVKRKLFREVSQGIEGFSDHLRKNDPAAALTAIEKFAGEAHAVAAASPVSLFSLGDQVQEDYERVKAGYTGIPLPWESLNQITMGLWPGTVTYFVARPGVGKTQVAMLIARESWRSGKKVLIVSPEMSKEAIAERFFIAQAEVSGTNVLRGTLSDFEHTKLKDTINGLRDRDGVWIVDAEHKLDGGGIDQYIRAVKPDLVCIDSIYDLSFPGNKSDRTMAAVDWMRHSSKKHDVPFVGFHQVNRDVGRKGRDGVEYADAGAAIALTDQLLWDAHAIFILEQDRDMLEDKRLRFHVGKKRRGVWDGRPIDCHWDFDRMCFDEIKGEEAEAYSDDFGVSFGE